MPFELHRNRMIDLGDCIIENTRAKKPRKIVLSPTQPIFTNLPESVKAIGRQMVQEDWMFYVVSQTRGYCDYRAKVITIPQWCIHKDASTPGYKCWYVTHEMAHAFTKSDVHGPSFMARLIDTCPPEYIHHEIGYKPRNARAAGIRAPSPTIEDNLGF